MKGNYLRPSELLKMQRETGKSYWDLIGRPLYDEGKNEGTREEAEALRYSLGVKLDSMPQIYDPLPMYGGGKGNDLHRYKSSEDFIADYEGFEPKAYKKGNDKWTIGYGTTDTEWVKRGTITEPEARQALREYVRSKRPEILKRVKNYNDLPDSAKMVLDDIMYNIGPGGLANSKKFLAAVNEGRWSDAVKEMDWDNNDPMFGRGARRRNAARGKLWMRDFERSPMKPAPIPVPQVEIQQVEPFDYKQFRVIEPDYSISNPAPAVVSSLSGADSPVPIARMPFSITQLMDQYIPKEGVTLNKPIWRVE